MIAILTLIGYAILIFAVCAMVPPSVRAIRRAWERHLWRRAMARGPWWY